MRPVPPEIGLALFVMLFLGLPLVLLWLLHRQRRRIHLREKGFCTECGYDLRGQDNLRCPECGLAFGLTEADSEGPERSNH